MTPGRPGYRASTNAFAGWRPRDAEGVCVIGRRSMLKASVAGLAGLTLPQLLQARAGSARSKSVILLWMAGGPSHIDMWDLKPEAPAEIRGPFRPIETKVPGIQICEHLPKQAVQMDLFTLIRSVDCQFSNHQPTHVMQTANKEADPRTNREGAHYPAIGSIASKHCPSAIPGLPGYVALNVLDPTHIAWGGYLGKEFDPFVPTSGKIFERPASLTDEMLRDRQQLRTMLDQLDRRRDSFGLMSAMDRFGQQAVDMVMGTEAREAFDLAREPATVRERYGEHAWARHALLARRLVEAGTPFVTVVLSNHRDSGTWDNHGDNIPPYGGINSGLKPLLPVFDHVITTLVTDLNERGLLDDVLVLAMGEFGRTPQIGTQGSVDGRNHWPFVMSVVMAGGGFRHGQVIGSTERDAGHIKERPVTPGDLAATIYHHLGVPIDQTYADFRGRPRNIIDEGKVIGELMG